MSNQPLRVAVIGAGNIANLVHYPSLSTLPGVTVVAACDLDAAKLEDTANRYHIPGRFTDYRRMLDESGPLDAVYAIGHPHHLYDAWMDILGRRLNLFIEKPLGLNLHQARALTHVAAANGVVTQVGFQRRANPLAVKLRERCLARGPITHAVCTFYKCEPGKPFLGARDHLLDDGVHAIDTLRWACGGGEVVRVDSVARPVGVPDVNFFAALLRFDTGATGVLVNSWTSGRRAFRLELHAPGICAELDPETRGTLFADGDTTGETFESREVAGSPDLHVFGGYEARSREFLQAIRDGTQPASHFGDALKTMEVADRILRNYEDDPGR